MPAVQQTAPNQRSRSATASSRRDVINSCVNLKWNEQQLLCCWWKADVSTVRLWSKRPNSQWSCVNEQTLKYSRHSHEFCFFTHFPLSFHLSHLFVCFLVFACSIFVCKVKSVGSCFLLSTRICPYSMLLLKWAFQAFEPGRTIPILLLGFVFFHINLTKNLSRRCVLLKSL